MIRVFLFFILLSSVLFSFSQAQELDQNTPEPTREIAADESTEAEIVQKVKKRLYPGGRDEEDLKVQAQLSTPVRKLAPQAEVKEETVEE